MNLPQFADLLERINNREEPSISYNLHGGIRQLAGTSPDTTPANHYGWGLPAWAHFFRDLAAAEYPEEVASDG